MNVVAMPIPIPESTLTWEQEQILLLRDRVHFLENELAAAKKAIMPAMPSLPIEWGLDRVASLGLMLLYENPGVMPIERLRAVMRRRARSDGTNNLVRVQIYRLRKAVKRFGIEILTRPGLGYELDPASRPIIKAALEIHRAK